MTERSGSPSSRHHSTSVVSPKVQIMAMPEPLSGSARRCATTGTTTPNNGLITSEPNSARYRSSSGWATSATQDGSSSGRVVSTSTGSPPPPPPNPHPSPPPAPSPSPISPSP